MPSTSKAITIHLPASYIAKLICGVIPSHLLKCKYFVFRQVGYLLLSPDTQNLLKDPGFIEHSASSLEFLGGVDFLHLNHLDPSVTQPFSNLFHLVANNLPAANLLPKGLKKLVLTLKTAPLGSLDCLTHLESLESLNLISTSHHYVVQPVLPASLKEFKFESQNSDELSWNCGMLAHCSSLESVDLRSGSNLQCLPPNNVKVLRSVNKFAKSGISNLFKSFNLGCTGKSRFLQMSFAGAVIRCLPVCVVQSHVTLVELSYDRIIHHLIQQVNWLGNLAI